MDKILLVEDSKSFAMLIISSIKTEIDCEIHWAGSYSEAEELVEREGNFFLGLLDLTLPDSSKGEILDLALAENIPSIVFTGNFNEEMRKMCWEKMVIDYVLKEGPSNLDYIVSLIKRIRANREVNVLVVDDSATSRKFIESLLLIHQYNVLEADNGQRALEILEENKEIKLVITDYIMPVMDGFDLVKRIRADYKKDELAVIGISAQNNKILSAKFIKNGANDFISKPFTNEEFYCRVGLNVEMIEKIESIKNFANKDFLTGLFNRKYFFEMGGVLHANFKRKNLSIVIGMIDIDHFKSVNDTYGHDAGDAVLKAVAALFQNRFRESDVVARFGGEEFCVLAGNLSGESAKSIFEEVRVMVENLEVVVNDKVIKVTISSGLCAEFNTLDNMIKVADEKLYEAKNSGRNMVVL